MQLWVFIASVCLFCSNVHAQSDINAPTQSAPPPTQYVSPVYTAPPPQTTPPSEQLSQAAQTAQPAQPGTAAQVAPPPGPAAQQPVYPPPYPPPYPPVHPYPYQQQAPPGYAYVPAPMSPDPASLRPRVHRLSFDYRKFNTKIDADNVSLLDQDTIEIELSYARNFGFFEVGGSYITSFEEEGSDEVKVTGAVLEGRVNFIENVPGNDVIPYIAVGFTRRKDEVDAGTRLKGDGDGLGIEFGVTWFPLGEIFAIGVSYTSVSVDGWIGDGTTTVDTEFKSRGFTIGYSVYF